MTKSIQTYVPIEYFNRWQSLRMKGCVASHILIKGIEAVEKDIEIAKQKREEKKNVQNT